ncbi:hypothetical protein ANN_21868 [Periplaneta americana]|uniref:RNase H type-1 domain-containing protein n=1 Tax=Periplaneta americana TaxID=6978 RepID=A0ABQ8S7K2_PERAM|nr:hypothetical protein ANN_21868 [Periplaneta americana]
MLQEADACATSFSAVLALLLPVVKNLIFQELTAVVDIVAVQDDISLPEEHEVSLISLYPTKQQEYDLNITNTAECLDQLRFFYNHLWWPWDCDDASEDWPSTHLEARLQLFYDMQSGAVLHETGQRIRSLLHEARKIEESMKSAQSENDSDEVDGNTVLELMKLDTQRENIKREVEILENPLLRNVWMKKKREIVQQERKNRGQPQDVYFVWLGGTVDEFIAALTKARNVIKPESYVKNLLCHIHKFRNAVILSDSKAAILSIVSKHTPSSQTAEITKMLSQLLSLNKRIVFQWIPSHCGILGNENADALAKKGSTATYRPVTKSTYYSVKRFIKSTYLDFNKQNLITQSQGKKWKSLHQNLQLIPDLPRKSSVAAFRLATGHDCLAKHLHRIGIYESPNCPLCNSNQEMDSEHLKICASVASHDNIFEKYWSARGQMTLLSKALLQDALDQAIAGDAVVLCPGIHSVCSTGGLEEGGSIEGFLEPGDTILRPNGAGNVIFDWSADVTLKNLTIDVDGIQMAMSIRHGTVHLQNCRVIGSVENDTGILVLKDGHLDARDCYFSNFGIGLVIDPGARVSMVNCSIMHCNVGIKAFEDSSIMLQNCRVSDCLEYGLKIEIPQQNDDKKENQQVGTVALLKRLQQTKFDNTIAREKWNSLHQNPQLIPDLPRKSSVAAFRSATGHDCLAKHLHRIGIYESPNCPMCNSNQEMDSEHLKICASVAGHDNIFEKHWSAKGQMTLLPNAWH